ncbi:hypothetical protein FOZ63_013651, partial [Perkinsus olseni]
QNALESSSIMCARTAMLISKLDGWYESSPEITVASRQPSIAASSRQVVEDEGSGSESWVAAAPYGNPENDTARMISDGSSSTSQHMAYRLASGTPSLSTGSGSVNTKVSSIGGVGFGPVFPPAVAGLPRRASYTYR